MSNNNGRSENVMTLVLPEDINASTKIRIVDNSGRSRVVRASDLAGILQAIYKPLDINLQTADYTPVLTDGGNYIAMDLAVANTVTMPANSVVAFPIGTEMVVERRGVGVTTLVAGAGATLDAEFGLLSFAAQYSVVSVIKVELNRWVAIGNLI